MPHLGRCGSAGAAGALDMFSTGKNGAFLPALAGDFTCFTGKKGTSPMNFSLGNIGSMFQTQAPQIPPVCHGGIEAHLTSNIF